MLLKLVILYKIQVCVPLKKNCYPPNRCIPDLVVSYEVSPSPTPETMPHRIYFTDGFSYTLNT